MYNLSFYSFYSFKIIIRTPTNKLCYLSIFNLVSPYQFISPIFFSFGGDIHRIFIFFCLLNISAVLFITYFSCYYHLFPPVPCSLTLYIHLLIIIYIKPFLLLYHTPDILSSHTLSPT